MFNVWRDLVYVIQIAMLPQYAQEILSNDPALQLSGAIGLRKVLSIGTCTSLFLSFYQPASLFLFVYESMLYCCNFECKYLIFPIFLLIFVS